MHFGKQKNHKGTFTGGVWCADDVLHYNPLLSREEAEQLAAQANAQGGVMSWAKLHADVDAIMAADDEEKVPLAVPVEVVKKPALPVKAKAPQHGAQEDGVMTLEQVADFAGLKLRTVRRLAWKGMLPSKRDGTHYVFDKAEVAKFFKDRGGAEKPAPKKAAKKPAKKPAAKKPAAPRKPPKAEDIMVPEAQA